ncbi:MAG: hypothetical protein M3460_20165 [Actinomycetota bacterium]|nr:hypothetical protein [Actinomycetota bacterium]
MPDKIRSATEVRTPLWSWACRAVSQRTASAVVAKPRQSCALPAFELPLQW